MTINDIKSYIFALVDQDITKNDSFTREILAKSPIFSDMAQRELLKHSRYVKEYSIEHTYDETTDEYKTYAMPSDFDGINYVINVGTTKKFDKVLYKIINKTLYVLNNITTNYNVVYTPILEPMTSMTSEFIIEGNIIYEAIPYFVASKLLANTNEVQAFEYKQEWLKKVNEFSQTQNKACEEKIIDIYGSDNQ